MTSFPIAELAAGLEAARAGGRAVGQLTASHPGFGLADAYRVQDAGIALRVKAGDRVVGYKMGLTSKAKMKQMGVEVPIMGVLTEGMRVPSGSRFARIGLIHPRIEPEVAFLLKKDLRGKVTAQEALAACSAAFAALEIIDSRYKDFKFTLPDVVADNCSSCGFVLGPEVELSGVDVSNLRIEHTAGGKTLQTGSSSEIYGHPAASLAELSGMLASLGKHLPAGSLVLAGAATAAVPLEPGDTRAVVEGLGEVSVVAA